MAKTKHRLKKMTFQRQERNFELPDLTEKDKYVIAMSGYQKGIGRTLNEILPRATRRASRPQYI